MVSGVHRAAHVDYLAADIGRQIRSEEQGDLGDVVGRTSAPQWNLLGPLFLDLVRQRVVMSVIMKPGAIALARIPRGPSSLAIDLARPISPAFDAE